MMHDYATSVPLTGPRRYNLDWRRVQRPALDGSDAEASWSLQLDGRSIQWERFYTGPLVLSPQRIDQLAFQLLGVCRRSVRAESAAKLQPYVMRPEARPRSVIMHGATQTTKGFEGDLSDVTAGRPAFDVGSYLEARAVYLATPGDLVIGRTDPWRIAAARGPSQSLDIGRCEMYYLSHALLELAALHDPRAGGPLHRLLDWVRKNPDCVVKIYALDIEMQIFLLWLLRQAGLDKFHVDANSAAVASDWNQKGCLHPTVEDALTLGFGDPQARPLDTLRAEQQCSRLYRKLDIAIPVLPGYTIQRASRTPEDFVAEFDAAAALLRERYGIVLGCIKPAEAGDGARIVVGVDLADRHALSLIAQDAYQHGDDYVLEPCVTYSQFELCGDRHIVAPSAHIRFGHVAPGCTAQLLKGASWFGNVYLDATSSEQFGVSRASYAAIRDAMEKIVDGFARKRESLQTGLVVGGIDFAIGQIGGAFGKQILVAAQDPNLSSHGAEYLRCFMDRVGASGRENHRTQYAATRVMRPTFTATIDKLHDVASAWRHDGARYDIVGCVPGRWSMLAVAAAEPRAAAEAALDLERRFVSYGLAVNDSEDSGP